MLRRRRPESCDVCVDVKKTTQNRKNGYLYIGTLYVPSADSSNGRKGFRVKGGGCGVRAHSPHDLFDAARETAAARTPPAKGLLQRRV